MLILRSSNLTANTFYYWILTWEKAAYFEAEYVKKDYYKRHNKNIQIFSYKNDSVIIALLFGIFCNHKNLTRK